MKYAALKCAMIVALALICQPVAFAHDAASHPDQARYIANEGILVQSGHSKVLFDPFSATGFGTYAEPSTEDVRAITLGTGAFANIDMVFISHAHPDHFSPEDILSLMAEQPSIKFVMPQQGVDMLKDKAGWNPKWMSRIVALDLDYGHKAVSFEHGDIKVDAVRIPHAGWPAPRRAIVQNMVYRVTLDSNSKGEGATVMHMGDADPRAQHYMPYAEHWDARKTDTAYPPYWFLTSGEGLAILGGQLNVSKAIGLHVPLIVPRDLAKSGQDYFSMPGEVRELIHDKTE